MYSNSIENLTRMRRLVQASGVRFLGYDRAHSLLDALSVLNPVAVLVDEDELFVAKRFGRQILAHDVTMPLIRLTSEATVQTVRRKAVGATMGQEGESGPYSTQLCMESSLSHLVATFGRLGILPRRLSVV